MAVELDQVYRHRGELVTREILGETIVVPITGELASMDDIFSLNDTGAYVWRALDGTRPLGEIRDGMTERFEVSAQVAESDLRELVATLVEAQLVEPVA